MSNPSRTIEVVEADLSRALDALEMMVTQYCGAVHERGKPEPITPDGKPMFHHMFESAGEEAIDVLLEFNRTTIDQCQVY